MSFDLRAVLSLNAADFQSKLIQSEMVARRSAGNMQKGFTDSGIGSAIEKIGSRFAVGILVAAAARFQKSLIDLASATKDGAETLGIGTDEYQLYGYAASQAGSSNEQFAKGMLNLQEKMEDAKTGNEDAIKSFQFYGVTLDDLRSKKPEEIYEQIGAALRRIKPDTESLSTFTDIFGKKMAGLIPGIKNLEEARTEMAESGLALSKEEIAMLHAQGRALTWLGLKAKTSAAGLENRLWRPIKQVAGDLLGKNGEISRTWRNVTIENRDKEKAAAAAKEKISNEEKHQRALAASVIWQAKMDKAVKLDAETEELRNKVREKSLTPLQRQNELLAEKARLTDEIRRNDMSFGGKDYETQSRLKNALAKVDYELGGIKIEKEKPESKTRRTPDVNELQRIGAYVSPTADRSLQVAEKQTAILEEIRNNTKPGIGRASGGTQF